MDQEKAVSIVSALADGVDPLTGKEFPADSPYQSAEVVRALYMVQRALEVCERSRTSTFPNAGKLWREEEDRQLLAQFDDGRSIAELARTLGRTAAGIQARLEKHGRLRTASGANGASGLRRSVE